MAEPPVTMAPSKAGRIFGGPRMGRGSRSRSAARGPVFALDTDGRSVWIAEAVLRGSKPSIARVYAATLPELDEASAKDAAALGKAIASALAVLKVHPGAVILAVPSEKVVLRSLHVPVSNDIRETASMVRFQAAKDLPFPIEDAVIDFAVRAAAVPDASPANETAAQPGMNVLAAAARRETVAFCAALAEASGFKLRGLGLRAAAGAAWVEAVVGAEGALHPTALVTPGRDSVQVDVVRGKDVLFTRSAIVGSVTEQEAFVKTAVLEVVRAVSGFSGSTSAGRLQRVLVCGGTGVEPAIVEALTARISVPCERVEAGKRMGLKDAFHEAADGAVTAMGLALAGLELEGLTIDLQHPKKPAQPRDMRRLRVLGGVALVAAAFLALVAVRVLMVKGRTVVLRQLELELAEAEKKRPMYRAMKQQAATLQEWTRTQRDWLDHYAYLSAVLPASEDIYLTSLAASGPSTLRLSVQARGGEILSRLDKQLRAAGYEVKPLAINPGADRYGYDFRSTVELVIPEKMKFELAKVKPPARPADDASLEPGAVKGARP